MVVHGRAAMDFSHAPADEDFRREVRAWLAANRPARAERIPHDEASLAEEFGFLRDWQRRLHAAGYVGLLWPREYGGRGAPPAGPGVPHQGAPPGPPPPPPDPLRHQHPRPAPLPPRTPGAKGPPPPHI